MQIGLVVSPRQPIEAYAARLRQHGVVVGPIVASESGNYITFEDPDGNPIYVGDWAPDFDGVPGETVDDRLARQSRETADAAPASMGTTGHQGR